VDISIVSYDLNLIFTHGYIHGYIINIYLLLNRTQGARKRTHIQTQNKNRNKIQYQNDSGNQSVHRPVIKHVISSILNRSEQSFRLSLKSKKSLLILLLSRGFYYTCKVLQCLNFLRHNFDDNTPQPVKLGRLIFILTTLHLGRDATIFSKLGVQFLGLWYYCPSTEKN